MRAGLATKDGVPIPRGYMTAAATGGAGGGGNANLMK